MKPRIQIVDCTLRDGEQAPGVVFGYDEKLRLSRVLSDAGVDILDAGFPSVSQGECDALAKLSALGLSASIGATVRAIREDIDLAHECGVKVAFMFHPTSDIHIQAKFGISHDEVERRIAKACAYASELRLEMYFVAEDSARQEAPWVARLCDIAAQNGAAGAILCDTVGVLTPEGTFKHVRAVKETMEETLPLGIHCHNDFGLATANTLTAVQAGCEIVTATINGIGERAGNAALEEVVIGLEELLGIDTGIHLDALSSISKLVERMSGFFLNPCKPVVGRNVFTHESGVHVHGMLADENCYEALQPSRVGCKTRYVLGKHSGRYLVQKMLSDRSVSATEGQIAEISARVKHLKESQETRCYEAVDRILDEHYEHIIGFPETRFWSIVEEVLRNG